jgi:polyphenol oxidase
MTPAMTLLEAAWPAPASVRTAISMRQGGVSVGAYASLNLGDHVGDDAQAVAANRARYQAAAGWPQAPRWLQQVHGVAVADAGGDGPAVADASFTRRRQQPCVVLTADCLPVLFCSADGQQVAAAHAGWRGLAAGVLEATIGAFAGAPCDLMAWLGPAIGPDAFQVGPEVRAAFISACADDAAAFQRDRHADDERYHADLFVLARARLARAGLRHIYGGGVCTHGDAVRWFSHRRDGVTGRFASAIWIASP